MTQTVTVYFTFCLTSVGDKVLEGAWPKQTGNVRLAFRQAEDADGMDCADIQVNNTWYLVFVCVPL